MLRVTTLYASSAHATAAYYTRYLAEPGELPGVWIGAQADAFGLAGVVDTKQLEALLSGLDPVSGAQLGMPLTDRTLKDGRVVRAVAGFDATLSAPKSLSVWWALTGDERLAEAHDVAARAVAEYLERFGATTRIRAANGRLHPDTGGLTVAGFRQSTSRMDDPQLHTHLVISAKVRTEDGRWFALDARMLKRHQRTLGGLYQSVLRAELSARFGVRFEAIVNGQAEIAGVTVELLDVFSKRTAQVDDALKTKLADFWQREGRDPERHERAALEREAAADTRQHKTGQAVTDLRQRWRDEAVAIGVTPQSLVESMQTAGLDHGNDRPRLTTDAILAGLSERRSSWHRMDVLRTICDELQPFDGMDGRRWVQLLDRGIDRVLDACIDLDPTKDRQGLRGSDGRSVWIEPTADHYTSREVLTQETAILDWAAEATCEPSQPSLTVTCEGLDQGQADAAAAAAGHDRLVVIVGPAGAGKTTMLRGAVDDLADHSRRMFAVAPTAKAARVLEREIHAPADTLAKLLHEWSQPDRPPRVEWDLPARCTVIVDEAGMIATADLHRLTTLAERRSWRLVLVGDPHQLQAVGRGGMFAELCRGDGVIELERIHRFTNPWEAAASLHLRHGDPRAIDTYEAHGRIVAGTFDEHCDAIANAWLDRHQRGESLAITTTTNDHVDQLNTLIQRRRLDTGQLDPTRSTVAADGQTIHVGDVVMTRRNQRELRTDTGDPVRNRERWTVNAIGNDGSISVTQHHGHGTVTLPADYIGEHVRLGYATTEHGNQGDTSHASLTLATPATTCRGLYVAMTRGRTDNTVHVITDTHDPTDARDVLEQILATDRADTPATTQQRQLEAQQPAPPTRPRRAEIPDWHRSLRDLTAIELHDARTALAQAIRDRAPLADAVTTAEHDLTAASERCRPYDHAVTQAREDLDTARQSRAVAADRATSSRLGQRRHTCTELAAADQHLDHATRHLTHVENAAKRPTAERTDANHRLDLARLTLVRHDAATDNLGHRVARLGTRLDALDTWRAWAEGRDVPAKALRHALHILDQLDPDNQRPTRPTIRVQRPHPDRSYGIDIDL